MNTADIKTFDECLAIAKENKKKMHLILGNGFSISLFPTIFNYRVLADKIQNDDIKKLFQEFNTSDFEYVMFKLNECIRVLDYYDKDSDTYKRISADIETLKEILISVIANNHPEKPNDITEDQYNSCYEFLKHFIPNSKTGKIYTFNYDLILYWTLMKFKDHESKKLTTDDGFRTSTTNENMITWQIGREREQNLYYIHGAMHIFKDKFGIIEKFNWINTRVCISEQVKTAIDNNKYPIFISEGTTEHKMKRITENGYLSRSMSSIKNITGNMFIFGHSIRDEDDHIFNLLLDGKVNSFFISIFGNPSEDYNQKIIDKIESWERKYINKKFYLYDASSAKIWNRYTTP